MAHHVEPMDIDSDFDNKENSLHYNNVLPFTEKGYDELDVSELNMKLRYSVTPASSPMSKSYTAHCFDNRSLESGDDSLNITVNENVNLTRSLNSTITKNDHVLKSLKVLPLQTIHTEQFVDSNRNTSVLRPLESTMPPDNANVTVMVSASSDIDENLSLPSSSSSTLQTPEATTPTKDTPPKDGGSPIMRGLKSVFSMFRSSQSPIPPVENENTIKPNILSPVDEQESRQGPSQAVLVSTPISEHRKKEMSPTKRSSPQKDSTIIFNEDLEKELQWKDETTIIFSQERIPIHKLMFHQQHSSKKNINKAVTEEPAEDIPDFNSTVEYMDISNNSIGDTTVTDIQADSNHADSTLAGESDTEFVDCETTFIKNDDHAIEEADITPLGDTSTELNITQVIENNNDSGSRLKPIILDTTQDILNATLTVKPEDLLPEVDQTKDSISTLNNNKTTELFKDINESLLSQFDKKVAIETKKEDPITTISIPEFSVVNAVEHKLDVTISENNEISQDKNVDVAKNKESALDMTLRGDNIADNLNTTIRNEMGSLHNKSFDIVNVVVDHVDNNKTNLINSMNANEHPISSSLLPTGQLTVDRSLSNDIEVSAVIEASATELPVNIPLPDEDDLLTTDITNPAIPSNLPLDLVDNIKLVSENIEPYNTEHLDANNLLSIEETNKCQTIVPNRENVSSVTTSVIEGNLNVNTELNSNKTASQHETHQINENIYVSEPSKETENLEILPEVTSLPIRNVNECGNNTDTELDNSVISPRDTVISVIKNEDVVLETSSSTDDNEIDSKYKPLPDIVNQTIAMSNTDNIETTVVLEVAKLLEPSENIDIPFSNTINLEAESHVLNEAETQISSVNHSKPIDLAYKNNGLLIIPDENTCNTENLPDDTNKTCTINSHIKLTESGNEPIQLEQTNQHSQTDTVNITSAIETRDEVAESATAAEEEVVLSGNNSPFTLIVAAEGKSERDTDPKDNEGSFATKTKLVITPPNSPPIRSKGYNFNFDDLDVDPFATKVNIRMSPTLDSSKNPAEVKIQAKSVEKPIRKKENRRQTQSERKRPTTPKKFNSTFRSSMSDNKVGCCSDNLEIDPIRDIQSNPLDTIGLNPNNVMINEILVTDIPSKIKEKLENESNVHLMEPDVKSSEVEHVLTEHNESSVESNVIELKATSSSEQSTYCSASDSSIPSRNVFNLPEIDDVNFNPFATKSKMRQSPPLNFNLDTNCLPISSVTTAQTEIKVSASEDKVENELMEKDASGNLSSTTTTVSPKATNEINETREIHTEDEDTIEGPFLEAENLSPEDKISDYDDDHIDMMQFNELPTQSNEENFDNGEMFIDAEAFEFLLNQNKANTVVDSGKESLFLKFDPLFAKRMSAITSDGVVASLAKFQNKQSTPTKVDQGSPNNVPVPGPSNLNETQDLDINNSEESTDDINITISKPMMVVPPAINPVTPRNKSMTPNRSNRRSITFTSPAMAVIDRLLSLSGNTTLYETTMTQVSREHNEAEIALSQLRELLAEKEINVYNLRSESNELRDRLNTLESHVRSLETESQDRLKKINELNDTLAEKTKINRSMAAVVEEYERTIASLIAETAQDKKRHAEERIKLINERDEQTAHLASMEVSFSDLHSKYEKSKQIILNCKANEESYKKSIKEFEENFSKMQNNYELLKQHATSKLNHANQEMEKINRAHEAEVLKLNAMIKRKELHITSLEESLIQKTKANEELTAICDELINKVG